MLYHYLPEEERLKMIDPVNYPDASDIAELAICRHCQDHIRPGAEVIWNGWTWHARCLPMLVLTETEERDKR